MPHARDVRERYDVAGKWRTDDDKTHEQHTRKRRQTTLTNVQIHPVRHLGKFTTWATMFRENNDIITSSKRRIDKKKSVLYIAKSIFPAQETRIMATKTDGERSEGLGAGPPAANSRSWFQLGHSRLLSRDVVVLREDAAGHRRTCDVRD